MHSKMDVKVFLLYIAVALVTGDDDREYCGQTYTTWSLGITVGDQLIATRVEGGHHQRSEMIQFNPASGAITLLYGEIGGTFPRAATVVTTGTGASVFCAGGNLFSADINGDSYQDLLCETAGVLTYKTYGFSNYGATQNIDATFACDTGSNKKILIGDFDDNHADDILCLDTAAAIVGAESSIYFNTACQTPYSYSQNHYHYHYHGRYARHAGYLGSRSFLHHLYYHHRHCDPSLPKKYTFPASSITTCDQTADSVILADVNNDDKADLVCHKSGDSVTYFLSSGSTSGAVFGSENSPGTALSCAFATEKIISADVDGDGDDDLVCVNDQADAATTVNTVAHFTAGDFDAFEQEGTACSTTACTDATTGVAVSYTVGDFNRDGFDDYLCRWDDATNRVTHIVYSVPIAI